jgi:hypothetical protein
MGIDFHGLKFLRYAHSKKPFGSVVTIGRQGLHLPPWRVRDILELKALPDFGAYGERLIMECFGATSVDSYDNSDYESATHVWDMNRPLAPEKKYDTVIDLGCLEHVYNVTQALKNVSSLANPGAQIVHVLPANGYCGHGFWQFSPELFFTLYSERNGYRDTEVMLADLANERSWFIVKKPRGGKRADVVTSKELYVLVRTTVPEAFSHDNVQQSDYSFAWDKSTAAVEKSIAPVVQKERPEERPQPALAVARWSLRLVVKKIEAAFRRTSLNSANSYLTRIDIPGRSQP